MWAMFSYSMEHTYMSHVIYHVPHKQHAWNGHVLYHRCRSTHGTATHYSPAINLQNMSTSDMYGRALVQCREYARAIHVVAACGPRVYLHSRVTCEYLILVAASYLLAITTVHA